MYVNISAEDPASRLKGNWKVVRGAVNSHSLGERDAINAALWKVKRDGEGVKDRWNQVGKREMEQIWNTW